MAAEKTYTAAIVGLGRIGYSLGLDKKREQPASHTSALNDNPRIKIIAGCDTDECALKTWHEANRKAAVYTDSANLYARHRPDIIVIAVNENAHQKEAVEAIKSKPKLVILEKPVALNMDEAKYIQAVAESFGVPVLVNHERRFAEDFKTAKKYLSSIGPVQSINACLCSSLCVYNPAEENSGAYSLLHDGTHLVDAVLYFLEKDSQISGTIQKAYHEEKKGGLLSMAKSITEQKPSFTLSQLLNEPVLTGIFRDEKQNIRQFSAHYSNGLCPDITISMSGRSRFFSFEVTITGTHGRICIGNGYLKLYRRENSTLYSGFYSLATDKNIKLPKKTLFFANMVKNAVDFLDNRASLLSTIQSGINALAVLEEIKRLFQKQQ